jgi:hypothetical protein
MLTMTKMDNGTPKNKRKIRSGSREKVQNISPKRVKFAISNDESLNTSKEQLVNNNINNHGLYTLHRDILDSAIMPFLSDKDKLTFASIYNIPASRRKHQHTIASSIYNDNDNENDIQPMSDDNIMNVEVGSNNSNNNNEENTKYEPTLNNAYSIKRLYPKSSLRPRKNINKIIIDNTFNGHSANLQNTNVNQIIFSAVNHTIPNNVCNDKITTFTITTNPHNINALFFCKNLQEVNLTAPGFNHSIDALQNNKLLKKLIIGDTFNQSIGVIRAFPLLETLKIGNAFNQPIDDLAIREDIQEITNQMSLYEYIQYSNLKQLTLGNAFNQTLRPLQYCMKLEELTIGNAFDQSIDYLKSCPKLLKCNLGNSFDRYIDILEYCPHLQRLNLGNSFRQSINVLQFCHELQELSIGDNFDKSIDALGFCVNLISLSLGNSFSYSILYLGNCTRLRFLYLGDNFNDSIDTLKHCRNLNTLLLGDAFNQSIDVLKYCRKVERLYIGDNFNQSIQNVGYCTLLTEFQVGEEFNQSIDTLGNCTNLEELIIPGKFDQYVAELSRCKNLEIISLGWMGGEQIADSLGYLGQQFLPFLSEIRLPGMFQPYHETLSELFASNVRIEYQFGQAL